MNNFDYAFKVLMSWEGGYSQTSGDPGGETYCGISRHFHPDWQGWEVVEVNKPMHFNQVLPNVEVLVNAFYFTNYWQKYSYPEIASGEVAAKIFQQHVNMGNRAIEILQRQIGVDVDGDLGPRTVNVVNGFGDQLLSRYCIQLAGYYVGLIDAHPTLEKFQNEWLWRARTIGVRP